MGDRVLRVEHESGAHRRQRRHLRLRPHGRGDGSHRQSRRHEALLRAFPGEARVLRCRQARLRFTEVSQRLTTSSIHQTPLRCVESSCRTLLSQGTIRFTLPSRLRSGLPGRCPNLRALLGWVSGIEGTRIHLEAHAFRPTRALVRHGRDVK